MRINLMRSLLISLGFMVAYAVLSPLGLGWVVTVAFVAFIGYTLWRIFGQRTGSDPSATADDAGESEERGGFLERMRGKKDHRDEEYACRAQDARARAQQEADCALTHEERVRFQDIVKGLNDAG